MTKTKPIRTTLYLPPALWKQCKILAIEYGTPATDIVVLALSRYLPELKREISKAKAAKQKGGQQ